MVDSDKTRFSVVMGTLGATFSHEPTPILMKAYFSAMADLEIEQVEQAAIKWIATGRFFPKPIELREQVQNTESRALAAWAVVERKLGGASIGYIRAITFTDGLINAVLRSLGGLPRVKAMNQQDFANWFRRDFLIAYRELQRYGTDEVNMKPLVESENAKLIAVACDWATTQPLIEAENHEAELIGSLARQLTTNKDNQRWN